MVLKEDQAKVKALLTEAITVLCKNGLSYRAEFSVEGLLGITLDNEEVFLIPINETIKSDFGSMPPVMSSPKMPQRVGPIMSAPPKPIGYGRGRGFMSSRGRPPLTAKPRKRPIEPDFNLKMNSSAPSTPTHASASPHSSLGSPPGTPGTPHTTGHLDQEQPPAKRPNQDDGAMDNDDVMIVAEEDSSQKTPIKTEPGGPSATDDSTADLSHWDATLAATQSSDPANPSNSAMQAPSFGDELNLGMDPVNIKMENQTSGTPSNSSAAGMTNKRMERRLPPPETLLGLRPSFLGVPSQFGTIPLSAFGQLGAAAATSALLQQHFASASAFTNSARLQQALAVQQQNAKSCASSINYNYSLNSSAEDIKPHISTDLKNDRSKIEIKLTDILKNRTHSSGSIDTLKESLDGNSSVKPGFDCTYRLCRSWFNSMQELHDHIKTVHQGSCYVCKECGKTFGSYMGLKFHSSKHTGKFRFNCPHCNKGFNRIEQFQSHINMHEGQGFVCLKCKKVFLHKAKLMQHSKMCSL